MTDALCPQCYSPLIRVVQPATSMLNPEQFHANKAGDYYCEVCKSNGRGARGLCYWWERETLIPDQLELKTLRKLIRNHWELHHEPSTCFLSMRHPSGGSFSLIEVKTYGGPFTVKEADRIAALIYQDLKKRLNELK